MTPGLVARAAMSEIERAVAPLPPSLAHNTFGFEVRLGDDARRADVLVQATAAHGRRELAHVAPKGEAWDRVRDFAARWAEKGSPLHERIDHVWLEFDAANGGHTPSAFFGFCTDDRPTPAMCLAATEAALRVLVRLYPRKTIARVFAAWPGELEVFQVGAMLGRGFGPVRVCLRGRTPESIVAWRPELRALVEMLAPATDYFCIDVDADEHRVRPRLGLECYVAPGEETPLLELLVREGLCTLRKRDAVLAWPGVTPSDPAGWPQDLLAAEAFLGARARSMLTRSVHHLKVVWDGKQPVEAKAYLACEYGWM